MRARYALLLACVFVLSVPVAASAHPMPANTLSTALGVGAATSLTYGTPVDDAGANFDSSSNMRLLSFSERRAGPDQFAEFNSDLAFWRDRAYQGTFKGFRIIDIDDPRNPVELIDYEDCGTVGQGDVVVWGSILVRSWDVNTGAAGSSCDGQTVPAGFEGLHVFDVSDPANPELKASIDLPCGSHTASGVPDLRNRRLLVYSTPSSGTCEGIDIVDVPLSRPESSELIGFEQADPKRPNGTGTPATNPSFACHDTGVILGHAMKAACAGGAGLAVWSIGGKDGGTLDDPRVLYNVVLPEIAFGPPNANEGPTGHSASFSWDGETIIFGHEPGGGFDPRCMATGEDLPDRPEVAFQNENQKSFFFFDADTGKRTGQWVFNDRPQTGTENCTLHNYNIVPTKRDDILVHGSYQSGIGVLDFSNRANAREIAFADPAPLPPTSTGGTQDGGDWSSYFYNGIIYEADITRGLFTWRLDDHDTERAMRLRHLNPQTQEFTIGARRDHDRWNQSDKWHDDRWEDRD
jgi:LVIVD repeat